MKRLLSTCLLMLCVSLPVLAGHTVSGGYCECGAPGCICDSGEQPRGLESRNASDESSQETPSDSGSETLLVLAVLLLVLRYKA